MPLALKRALLCACILALVPLPMTTAGAQVAEEGDHSPNMRHVANIGYEARNDGMPNYGTDIEFATLEGRNYALGGSYENGLQIVDISDPEQARIASVDGVPCGGPSWLTSWRARPCASACNPPRRKEPRFVKQGAACWSSSAQLPVSTSFGRRP
jgi:hypothetical protein